MKIEKKFTIIGLSIIVIIISMIIGISFALPEDITSSEYIIKNNTIYAVPTTYNFRVEELLSKINSSNELSVYNTNNELLVNGNKVSNGYTLKSGDSTYNIVVLGDVTDDGTINLGDVSKLYNAYKKKTSLNDNEIKAADITKDNKVNISDVSKLYNYFKGNSPFSYFDDNMIDVDNLVDKANSYYESNTNSNLLGTNLINELQIDNNFNDQVVITRNGEVEIAIKKQDKCYRKSALNDYIYVVDEEYCNVDVTKFASNNGRLHVEGSKLMNSKGEEFRVVGLSNGVTPMSKFAVVRPDGNKMYTDKSVKTLKSWGANGFRTFIGKEYWESGSEDYNRVLPYLYEFIDTIIANDMYIILNWSPGVDTHGAPQKEAAKYVFNEISSHYKNDYHIIYEIWNEPTAAKTWDEIKAYAEEIIPVIRTNAPDSIILVGSPDSDTRVDLIIGNELTYKNIMYSHHSYTSGVRNPYLGYLLKAIEAGLPIFETETSSVDSGIPEGDYIDAGPAYTYFNILKKYNISYMYFCWESGLWSYNIVDSKKHTWDESLPDSILRESGKFVKKMLGGNIETDTYMMKENSENTGDTYRSNEWKDKIISVSFDNKLSIPKDAVVSWDLSYLQDETIMGYLKPSSTSGMYDLVICSNKKINLPVNSGKLFKGLSKVKSYDFSNVSSNMLFTTSSMFSGNSSLETIDLSNLKSSSIVSTSDMFSGCTSLVSVNFKNWNTSKLKYIAAMFYNCPSLKSVDLSGFNVTKVNDFSNLFYNDKKLETVNISTWTNEVATRFHNAFYGNEKITEIDLSGFTTINSSCTYTDIFKNVPTSAVIKIGDEAFKTKMQSEYPSLNIE